MGNREIIQVQVNGRPFRFPRDLEVCVHGVLSANEYCAPKLPDVRPEDIRTVLDIGANVGSFVRWAEVAYPKVEKFICYEPHPDCAELLRFNCPNAEVHQYAISAAAPSYPTSLGFSICLFEGNDWGMNTISSDLAPEGNPRFNVDAFHPCHLPPCDLLKIDAEGVELEVLQHYLHLGTVKIIALEWHRTEHRLAIERILSNQGLRLFRQEQALDCSGRMMWMRSKAHFDWAGGKYVL